MVEKTMGPWRSAIQNRRHSSTRFSEQKPRPEARERWRSRLGDDDHVDRQKNANSFVGIIVNDIESPPDCWLASGLQRQRDTTKMSNAQTALTFVSGISALTRFRDGPLQRAAVIWNESSGRHVSSWRE